MKILIDIGHPAHLHYYRNFIKLMQDKGHDFVIIARDKEVIFRLLKFYKIDFLSRGRGGNGILGKVLYFVKAIYIIRHQAKKQKADLLIINVSHLIYFAV